MIYVNRLDAESQKDAIEKMKRILRAGSSVGQEVYGRRRKNERNIFTIICTVARRNITEVPNVVGKTYQDACNILSNNGLNYSQVLDDDAYVMKQNPIAGTIVEKDSQVELTIQERTEEINIQKIEEEVWKSIEVNFTLNNYEQMLKIAEENQLMENEKMLNILGILS